MTKKYYGEETRRRVPAALLMAVIIFVGVTVVLFMSQNSYANDDIECEIDTEYFLDMQGNEIFLGNMYTWEDDTEYSVSVFEPGSPYGTEYMCKVKKIEIIKENPRNNGDPVAFLKKKRGYWQMRSISYGQVTLKVTLYDEEKNTYESEVEINVVPIRFEIRDIAPKNGEDTGLPGESIEMTAELYSDSPDQDVTLDDFEYEWTIDSDDSEDINKFFAIDNADTINPTVRLKSKEDILKAFPEADESDYDSLFNRTAEVKLTVRYDGREIVSDPEYIMMSTEYYQIGDLNDRHHEMSENARSASISLKLNHIEMGVDGKANLTQIPSDKVEFEAYGLEGVTFKQNGETGTLTLKKNEAETKTVNINAYMDEEYMAAAAYTLQYVPMDIDEYDVYFDRTFTITDNSQTFNLEDLKVRVAYDNYVLSPDKYTLKVERHTYDKETYDDIFEEVEGPFGIHEEDQESGITEYAVTATAKVGSGLNGETGRSYFEIWNKYNITYGGFVMDCAREEMEFAGEDSDYNFFDDVWDDLTSGKYSTEYSIILLENAEDDTWVKLRNENELVRDRDYKVTYYNRDPRVVIDESMREELDKFPTEPGTYLAKAEGIDPYTGTMYCPFDIVLKMKGAQITGVTSKTYDSGKRVRQTKKNIKVVLNGKTLRQGTDYEITYDDNQNAGTAKMHIVGKWKYNGVVTKSFKINKGKNPLKVSLKKKTHKIKYKKLKKKNQTITAKKVFKVTKKAGKLTYKKTKGNKKILINKKTGKITIKKGLKKGTYKVRFKVTAAGNKNYKALSKIVTVTFKVK